MHDLYVKPSLETGTAHDLLTKPTLSHGSLVGLFGEVTFELLFLWKSHFGETFVLKKVTFESLGKIELLEVTWKNYLQNMIC